MTNQAWPLYKLLDLLINEVQYSLAPVLKNKNQDMLKVYVDHAANCTCIKHIARANTDRVVLGEVQISKPGIHFGADVCHQLNLNPADDSWIIDGSIFRQIDDLEYSLECFRQNIQLAPHDNWRTETTAIISVDKLDNILFCAPSYINRWRHAEFSNGLSKLVMKPVGERYSEVYVTYHRGDKVSKPIEVYFDFMGDWPQQIYEAFNLNPNEENWYIAPSTFKEKSNEKA